MQINSLQQSGVYNRKTSFKGAETITTAKNFIMDCITVNPEIKSATNSEVYNKLRSGKLSEVHETLKDMANNITVKIVNLLSEKKGSHQGISIKTSGQTRNIKLDGKDIVSISHLDTANGDKTNGIICFDKELQKTFGITLKNNELNIINI